MARNRGAVVLLAGAAMWIASRLFGSPAMEIVAIGLIALPVVSSAAARRGRLRLVTHRHLSEPTVSSGTPVTVTIEVENRSTSRTPFLLAEDQIPSSLGRAARIVVPAVQPRGTRSVSYTIVPKTRGRYRLGPITLDVADSFALSRRRVKFDEVDELLVSPEIEDLMTPGNAAAAPSFGVSRARQLFRTGEDFYTMRAYRQGDDLRRLHWPSIARTGELMIRQDESSRRAAGLVFFDNRQSTIGRAFDPGFERGVSVAATLGALFARNGFSLRLATSDTTPSVLTEARFLEALTTISHASGQGIGGTLSRLRSEASADTSLVVICAPPSPTEVSSLIRTGSGFGPKLAVLIHPVEPATQPPERQAQMEGRATEVRLGLLRAGWDCLVLNPSTKLKDRWSVSRERPLARSG